MMVSNATSRTTMKNESTVKWHKTSASLKRMVTMTIPSNWLQQCHDHRERRKCRRIISQMVEQGLVRDYFPNVTERITKEKIKEIQKRCNHELKCVHMHMKEARVEELMVVAQKMTQATLTKTVLVGISAGLVVLLLGIIFLCFSYWNNRKTPCGRTTVLGSRGRSICGGKSRKSLSKGKSSRPRKSSTATISKVGGKIRSKSSKSPVTRKGKETKEGKAAVVASKRTSPLTKVNLPFNLMQY